MNKKTFIVRYNTVALESKEVQAKSFDEAFQKVKDGKGKSISLESINILPNTFYQISQKNKKSIMTHIVDELGNLKEVILDEKI